jgi:hypothetical protein
MEMNSKIGGRHIGSRSMAESVDPGRVERPGE